MTASLIRAFAALALTVGFGLAAWAGPTLSPANPQPSGLKSGLAVSYAFPTDVKSLSEATQSLAQSAKRGTALSGLSYPDRGEGANVLTASQPHFVAARITGYIRFDAAGEYGLELFSNDGAQMSIGGQMVSRLDERSPCSSAGEKRVTVPQAGWYPIEVVYFQRWSTACLELDWIPPGGAQGSVPNAAFGH
jgi:hypothetical protein